MKCWASWKWSWRRSPGNQPVQCKIGKFGPEVALILGLWVTCWLSGGSLQDHYQNVRNFISFRLVPLDVPLSQSTGYFRFHFRSFSGCFDCFSVLLLKDPSIFFTIQLWIQFCTKYVKRKKIHMWEDRNPVDFPRYRKNSWLLTKSLYLILFSGPKYIFSQNLGDLGQVVWA